MTPYVKNNISTLLVNALATIPSPARIPPITVHHLNEKEVLISPDTGAVRHIRYAILLVILYALID
jgi:hypothetical protein